MNSLLLLLGALSVNAEIVVKHLTIHERGTQYTQTITLDHERNIQTIEVPAHNHIVHSKTIFDFNQGVLFESHPNSGICYMKNIPQGMVDMQKFQSFLEKRTGPITASEEKTTRRVYTTTSKMSAHQLSSMAQEVTAECGHSNVYQVKQISEEDLEISVSKAPRKLMDHLREDPGCDMADACLWQTCQYGDDSCWWTVNCDITEDDCQETLEHNSINHECADANANDCQISCKACYNTMCPGCAEGWEACRPVFDAANMGKCPEDPLLGKNCGQVYCTMPESVDGGSWMCPGHDANDPKVKAGQTCMLFCGIDFGGSMLCNDEGLWEEVPGAEVGCEH
eukprot:TRINITY_DN6233_c0_g1_i1.p1 TRINITY_DN6233_c0_g1~~TRINITY_DN6233_c0_g1_i1.p1  ORF type:complete len:338 (-),score=96.89 TRINITY_DN6233_c0_g1_i1:67-1080(-)